MLFCDAVVVTDNASGYHAARALKAMGTRVVAVVDHNETAKALLWKRRLESHVTIALGSISVETVVAAKHLVS